METHRDATIEELIAILKAIEGKQGRDGHLWIADGTTDVYVTFDSVCCLPVVTLDARQAEILNSIWS